MTKELIMFIVLQFQKHYASNFQTVTVLTFTFIAFILVILKTNKQRVKSISARSKELELIGNTDD